MNPGRDRLGLDPGTISHGATSAVMLIAACHTNNTMLLEQLNQHTNQLFTLAQTDPAQAGKTLGGLLVGFSVIGCWLANQACGWDDEHGIGDLLAEAETTAHAWAHAHTVSPQEPS